jgi:hypothetical protein
MRAIVLALTLTAIGAAQQAAAANTEFQITPRAGVGNLRLDELQLPGQDRMETDTIGLGCGFGVLTPVGVVLEAGVDSYGNFDIFDAVDKFTLTQEFLSVGYQFELGSGWRLVPRVGRAYWKLRSEEGRLFHPGPEAVAEVHGYDYFWEASVSRRISRVVTLGVGYKQGNYDFGHTRTTSFMVTLGW